MSSIQKRSISLRGEQAAFIDAKVATGDYASVSEVVRAGLRALEERDQTPRASDADPSLGKSLSEVRAQLKARHEARIRSDP